jgi:hypothetical protein
MESWRDNDMVGFENRVLPVVLAGERQIAQLTNTQLATEQSIMLGTSARPAILDLKQVTGATLRQVDPSEVYRRPQKTLNFELSRGKTVTQAVSAALARLMSITSTDLQLARTHTVARQGRGSYFRRILTGSENCALCVIASTQRYRRGKLAPIHGGCDCSFEQVFGSDPGQVLDRVTLETVHAAIEAEFGLTDLSARYIDGINDRSDFLDVIVVRENGETGPTLVWRDQHFRGPAAVAAS